MYYLLFSAADYLFITLTVIVVLGLSERVCGDYVQAFMHVCVCVGVWQGIILTLRLHVPGQRFSSNDFLLTELSVWRANEVANYPIHLNFKAKAEQWLLDGVPIKNVDTFICVLFFD